MKIPGWALLAGAGVAGYYFLSRSALGKLLGIESESATQDVRAHHYALPSPSSPFYSVYPVKAPAVDPRTQNGNQQLPPLGAKRVTPATPGTALPGNWTAPLLGGECYPTDYGPEPFRGKLKIKDDESRESYTARGGEGSTWDRWDKLRKTR